MAKIVNFSGGLTTLIDPTKVSETKAVYITNADINSGSMVNVKGAELFADTIQYKRNSGYLYYTTYNSNRPPEVVPQENSILVTPLDTDVVPIIPEKVQLDLTRLPSAGPNYTANLGPRGTITGLVGSRTGRFLAEWRAVKNNNIDFRSGQPADVPTLPNFPGIPADFSMRPGEATFSNGYLIFSGNPLHYSPYTDVNESPLLAPLENPTIYQDTSTPGTTNTVPIVIKLTKNTGEVILYRVRLIAVAPSRVVDANGEFKFYIFRVAGFGHFQNEIPEVITPGAAPAQETFNGDDLLGANMELWTTAPETHWTLAPTTATTPLGTNDNLWITYVTFDDANNASYTTPINAKEVINEQGGLLPTLTEIVKKDPLTLSNEGLPANTTVMHGYLYLTRPLTTLLPGDPVNPDFLVGSVDANSDYDIDYLVVDASTPQDATSIAAELGFKLTIPTGLDTSGSGTTARSPISGTYSFQAVRVTNVAPLGVTLTGFDNPVVIIMNPAISLGMALQGAASDTVNLRLNNTQFAAATNTAEFDFHVIGPHPSAPTVSNGAYNTIRDMFTNPEDITDASSPIPWTLNASIELKKETWRVGVVINQNGTLTFGTPYKIYNGSLRDFEGAKEAAVRVPATGRPSLERPINIVVGANVNNMLTVTESFHLKDGRWYFGDTERDYIEYQDRLFYTQDVGVPEFIDSDNNEVEMGIPIPEVPEDNPITITGDRLPAAWNPVVREIDLGPGLANPFPGNYGAQFQYVLNEFSNFDQSRIIRTFDTNVGGHEVYNSVITTLPGGTVAINHLQIILDVFTTDRTLISVGNVNCSNFQFHVRYGSGGGGHGRPTPIAIINHTEYFNMVLVPGGSYRAPIWKLGRRIGTRSANDSNRTVTFNRLPKPIPPGNTHSIDWEVWASGAEATHNYRLGAFVKSPIDADATLDLIRTYDFSVTASADSIRFNISDKGQNGWRYKLYRESGGTYYEVLDFGNQTVGTTNNRVLIAIDDVRATNDIVDANKTIGDISQNLPNIIVGTAQYAITNVNETYNLESPPHIIEAEAENNANARLVINNIPQETDPRVEYRYIYKIDSIYPTWGFIGKISPTDTTFQDNVNFTQSSLYIYTKRTGDSPPPIPELKTYTEGTRGFGQWDGTYLTEPDGWTRDRSAFDEGERLYRSAVTLSASASGGTTTYTASYSVPQEVEVEGLVIRTGESLNSERNWEPQPDLRFLTLYRNTLFAAGGGFSGDNVLWFSRFGHPHYWPRENFFEFPDPITGLLSIQQGLLIFTRFKTYILIGSTTRDFAIGTVSEEQGCLNHKTAVFVKGTPLWISDDGIVTYRNGRAQVISREFITETGNFTDEAWQNVKNAVYWKDTYHVLFGKTGDPRFDDKIFCLDFRYFPKAYMCSDVDLPNESPVRLGRFDDNKLYLISRAPNGVDFHLRRLMTNNKVRTTCEYQSPMFTDGDSGKIKSYNKIYICYRGEIEIRIKINDRFIPLNNGRDKYDHTNGLPIQKEAITRIIRVPQGHNRGYTIQFFVNLIGSRLDGSVKQETDPINQDDIQDVSDLSELISISYEPWPRLQNQRVEQGRQNTPRTGRQI